MDLLRWREISISSLRPLARSGLGRFFDTPNNRMIIFGGGLNQGFLNELWALDLTPGNESWTQLHPQRESPPRFSFAYAYLSRLNRFYIYGGCNDDGTLGDIWVLDLSNLSWTQLFPIGEGPGERRCVAGVWHPFNDNIIFFGGNYPLAYYFSEAFLLNLESGGTKEWQRTLNILGSYLLVNSPAVNSCRIRFILPNPEETKIRILNITGRLVKELYSGKSPTQFLLWDGTDENGRKVNSGIYICELETERESIRKKFVFNK